MALIQPNYPADDVTSKRFISSCRFLIKRIVEVVVGCQVVMSLFQQWMVPSVKNSLVPFSVSVSFTLLSFLSSGRKEKKLFITSAEAVFRTVHHRKQSTRSSILLFVVPLAPCITRSSLLFSPGINNNNLSIHRCTMDVIKGANYLLGRW